MKEWRRAWKTNGVNPNCITWYLGFLVKSLYVPQVAGLSRLVSRHATKRITNAEPNKTQQRVHKHYWTLTGMKRCLEMYDARGLALHFNFISLISERFCDAFVVSLRMGFWSKFYDIASREQRKEEENRSTKKKPQWWVFCRWDNLNINY